MSLFHSRILVPPNISPIRPIFETLQTNKSSILDSLHKHRDNEKTTPRQRIRCLIYALNYIIPGPLMPVRCGLNDPTLNCTRFTPQQYPPTQQRGAAIFGSLRSFLFPHHLSDSAGSLPRQFRFAHPLEDDRSTRDTHYTRDIHSTQTLPDYALPPTPSLPHTQPYHSPYSSRPMPPLPFATLHISTLSQREEK